MSTRLPGSRRTILIGLSTALCIGGACWWQSQHSTSGTPSSATGRARPPQPAASSAAIANAEEKPAAAKGGGLQRDDHENAAAAAVSALGREMDMKINPYAGALHGPAKSKRDWDANYMAHFQKANSGDPVSFELTNGVMAEGTVKIVQNRDGAVTYVSGELTAPEPGKFFFLTPPAGGKAGKAVGVVEFPQSAVAYRVEPTGSNGEPQLMQRQMDEVVCGGMAEVEPEKLKQSQSAPDAEGAVPLRPGSVPNYTPSYNGAIPSLQSYPGSPAVLFLDFAGGYSGSWGGGTFTSAGNSPAEIRSMWERVSEDYMPFNINVTTDPKVFAQAAEGSRMRCCVGPDTVTTTGVAYIGSWNWGGEVVCWANYSTGKVGSETCAHEPGHTLGLGHQGQVFADGSVNGYYAGQGSGETGWAPIMGASYYDNVCTWAKGEYQYANNQQDELLTITTANNNVHYRTDDTGSTLATSRYLDVDAANNVSAEGAIETSGDTDAFQFTTTGGTVTITAKPVSNGPNLGLMATIANSSGTVLATDNVQSKLSATITTTLAAGTYTFNVTGVGKNNVLTDGFSNYGSLGYYSINGNVAGARQPTVLSVADHAAVNTVVGTVPANNPNSSPLTYSIASGNPGGTFTIDNSGVVKVANNSAIDYFALAANPALYAAQFELFVNIVNNNNSAYNETNRRVVISVQKVLPSVPTAISATPDTDLRADVSWTGDPDATSYILKRSTTSGGPYTTVATTSIPTYTDSGLSHGVTYYYVVCSANANGQSANSSETSVTGQALSGFSFEAAHVGNGYVYNPSGTNWTFGGSSGNGSGIAGNGSGFGNPAAPDGSQVALIQGTGTISQTITGFVPGTTYQIRYAAAERGSNVQTWDVKIDGTTIQSNPAGSGTFTNYVASFTASAATQTLSFVGTNLAGGDNTIFLDNVQISGPTPAIGNADFETPVVSSHQYGPTGGSWTFSGMSPIGSGIVRNGGAFQNANAPTGVQAGFVQQSGTMSQALTGFVVGKTYTLQYASAQRPGNNQTWDVKLDGTVLQSRAGGGTGYVTNTVNFTATSTSHTLSFVGTNLNGGDNTVFIDNVNLVSPLQPVAPVITMSSPANNTVTTTTSTVTLTAAVTANSNVLNSVQFYADGTTLIGTATTSPYTVSWVNPTNGKHTVFARLLFDNGQSGDSAAINVTATSTNQALGFESPAVGGGAFQYSPAGSSWVYSASGFQGSGLLGNGSAFGNPNAVEGSQAAFLQMKGDITQTMSGFTPGTNYTITYAAAQRATVNSGGETFDVTVDGKVIKSNLPGGTAYADSTATFTATSAIHTIAFVGTNKYDGDNTVFLDNVRIAVTTPAVPAGLTAAVVDSRATLGWGASFNATSYNVKRATTSGGPYTTLANVGTTSYTDNTVTNGTTYYYVVSAVNAGVESANSGQVSAAPQAPAFANSGIETPAIGAGAYQYASTGAGWAFAGTPGNGSGIVANGSGFSNPNAPQGTQAAFVQTLGTMSEAVSGLAIGKTYTVTFSAAQRPGANQHGGETWNVKIDSTIIGSYNPGPAATTYVDYTATFTATAATQTLTFAGTNLVGGDNTVFIDNVRIAGAVNPIPSPWAKQDLGVSGAASSASYLSGVFTLNGAGTNVDGTSDSVSLLSQVSSGDCSNTVRVASLRNSNPNAKAGVMVRESLNANASEAGVWVTPANGIIFTTRTSTGATTTATVSTGKVAPYWVRITRTGNSFAGYYSANGTTWTQIGTSTTITMSSAAYIAIGTESGDANQVTTSTVDNVTAVP